MESRLPPSDPNQHFFREIEQLTRDFAEKTDLGDMMEMGFRRNYREETKYCSPKHCFPLPDLEDTEEEPSFNLETPPKVREVPQAAYGYFANEKDKENERARFAVKMAERGFQRMEKDFKMNPIPPDREEMCCTKYCSPKHCFPLPDLEDTEEEPSFNLETPPKVREVPPAAYGYFANEKDKENERARFAAKMAERGFQRVI